jgi:hypothetical protein
MTPNHFDGNMTQRLEKPVLSPIERLRKIKADRIELAMLKKNDAKPVTVKHSTAQELIDLVEKLLPE